MPPSMRSSSAPRGLRAARAHLAQFPPNVRGDFLNLLGDLRVFSELALGRGLPPILAVPARDAPDGLRDERVPLGTRKLALERRERLDEFRRLECPVSSSDRYLIEDA